MKGQLDKALELYDAVLKEVDGTPDLDSELQLFNKVGDLYLKLGKVTAGVETYERAITRYEEAGFPNNAIALCNKVLRTAPGRTPVYLKLAKLMIERGFVAEAKQNLLEYADRMQAAGQLEEAFRALKDFADLSPDNEEIRLLLAEQLQASARTDEAREQLAKLYAEVEAQGDERKSRATLSKMKAIDPDYDVASAPKHKVKSRQQKSSDLVFLDLDETPAEVEEEPEPVEPEPEAAVEDLAIETSAIAGAEEAAAVNTAGLEIEHTSLVEEEEEVEAPGAGLDIERTSLADEEEGVAAPAAEMEEVGLIEPEPAEEIEPIALDEIDLGDLGAGAVALDLDVEIELEPETEPAAAESEPVSEGALDVPDLDLGAEGFGEEAAAEPAAATADDGALGNIDLLETELEAEVEEEEEVEEPVMVAPAAPAVEARPTDPEALEAMVADDPNNASLHRSLAEALLERGDRERGLEELGHALGLYEEEGEWDRAEGVAQEILRIDPNSILHQQKRVELAFRKGDKNKLAEAYLGLANALFRSGAAERARAVYQRVLEHDPENESALLALETLQPVPEETPAATEEAAVAAGGDSSDFIDLGALILEEEPKPKDTRMRIEEEEPTGDEQRDFEEMLSAFKKGIEANVADEDWEAHYDLGVAFKEMGLLDEAIAEFQKSLRAPEGRLKTAEALGLCFYEKGQYSVAATVLRRAVEADAKGDEGKISLLYWIGRCDEEQGKSSEALAAYQRVFAVDINFQDISDRVKSLAGAGS